MDVYRTLRRSVEKELGRHHTSLSRASALFSYEHVTMLLGRVL